MATSLRGDGHDATALTLPGLESADADRSAITLLDHVEAISQAVEAAAAPVVLAVHSGTGFAGYAASDRVPERIAAMVYVDSAPGFSPVDPDFAGAEKPMNWDEIAAEENLDGLSDEQLATFRERAVPEPGGVLREVVELTNDARLDIPSTIICTGFTSEEYKDAVKTGLRVACRTERDPQRHLDRPADQSLAHVVASARARGDHRQRREGTRSGIVVVRRRCSRRRACRSVLINGMSGRSA